MSDNNLDIFGLPMDGRNDRDNNYGIDTEREKAIIMAQMERDKIDQRDRLREFIDANTPNKGVTTKEFWDVPMPSHNEYLKNKDVDFNVYGGLMLESNYGGIYNTESQRYIYKNKLDNKEIANMCNISESTVKRAFNKLKKVKIEDKEPLITTENTPNGIVYKLNYAVDDKYYVTIPNDILQYLIDTTNNNMIKLYVFFKVQLANGSKQMQREFIANAIGLNGSSKKALDVISNMTNSLVANGLITKTERVEFFYDETKDREVPKTLITYGLVGDEHWREYQRSLTKKK